MSNLNGKLTAHEARSTSESHRVFAEPDGVDATWVHREARQGFETAFLRTRGDGHRLIGRTCAIEDGVPWSVGYVIDVDSQWRTIGASLNELSAGRESNMTIESDRAGRWTVDGTTVEGVEGCLDIDLESSALTNTIFLHRVQPSSDETHAAPALFVRCAPLRVERVDQTYRLIANESDVVSYAYESPAFGTDIELRFDRNGLVLDYPGLAVRCS